MAFLGEDGEEVSVGHFGVGEGETVGGTVSIPKPCQDCLQK